MRLKKYPNLKLGGKTKGLKLVISYKLVLKKVTLFKTL